MTKKEYRRKRIFVACVCIENLKKGIDLYRCDDSAFNENKFMRQIN